MEEGPHPYAFLVAVVATPLVIGILGIPLIIPPFAALMGLPAYLICGVPVFLYAAHRWERAYRLRGIQPDPAPSFALAGFIAHIGTLPVMVLYADIIDGATMASAQSRGFLALTFGMVFAPLHGAVFGLLYRRLARTFRAPAKRAALANPIIPKGLGPKTEFEAKYGVM